VPELERTLPTTFAIPPVAVADLYRRGERLFRLHRYREALKAFELARQAAPGQPLAPETLYHVGMAQHHTRDNTAAMETFRQLHDHAPFSSFAATALFMQGRLALRMRQDETFLDHAHTLTARFPGTKEAEEIGYLLGHFYRNRGRVPEAMQAFQHVIERGRRSAFADDAWWYLGWLQYGAGQYERATQTWGRLMNAFPSSSLAGDTLYWQGRALLRAGRTGEASARFEHLWRTYPQTYYGYLAQAQLTGRRAWPWEATWDQSASGALAQSRPPPIPPPTPGTNFHARRGNELWTMRIYRDAAEEFQAASAEGAQHVQFLFYAALAHHWAGEHSQAMHLLRRHGKALAFQGAGLSQADLQEITYPLGALRHLEASALSGIDPLFIGALIMAESAWNPRAFSRVGARGLMQLMPETGQRLAQSTGVALASDDRLFEPHLNLKLGIAYLRQLLQHFNSLLPLALASYNAGEEEVDQWWAKRGNADIEEFIADMPFRETRSYVQRVLVYYAEYQRIYRGKEG
jgi:soluble lytic murein transglycosylase